MGGGLDLRERVRGAEQAGARRCGCGWFRGARLEVLPAEDRSLPHWAVPTLEEESAHRSVLVVSVPDTDTGSPLQCVPRVEGPVEDPVGEVLEESGRGKSQFKIRDLLADGRCSQAVIDFFSSTDVGGLVPAEEDARSETSEWERRERRERGGERRGLRSWVPEGRSHHCFSPRPPFMASVDEE